MISWLKNIEFKEKRKIGKLENWKIGYSDLPSLPTGLKLT